MKYQRVIWILIQTIAVVYFPLLLSAQPNLVPNHSFEHHFRCPTDNVHGERGIQSFVYNWLNCYQLSQSGSFAVRSQYYHTCSRRGFGIPQNTAGYQHSIDGNAYAGIIITYQVGTLNYGHRVFLSTKLLRPLKKNKLYQVSFMASPMDSFAYYFSHLGLRFFVDEPRYMGVESINNLPNNAHAVDTTVLDCEKCWYKISGEVVADSAYEWIVIGNFYRQGHFKHKKIPNGKGDIHDPSFIIGGYYIDDVWVQEVQQLFASSTRICKGDSVALWSYKLPTGSLWDDGMQQYTTADTQWVKPQATTTYTIYTPAGEVFDSITIEVFEPPSYKILPVDTLLCRQPYITLRAAWPGSEYLWSTNSTAPSINFTEPGMYKVRLGLPNCRVYDSVKVEVCEPTLFIPNAFSPNGDGINDVFKPEGVRVHYFNMQIYNRWGRMVFESNDIQQAWDGYGCATDVYVYIINYEDDYGTWQKKGTVTLIR